MHQRGALAGGKEHEPTKDEGDAISAIQEGTRSNIQCMEQAVELQKLVNDFNSWLNW